MGAKSGIDSVVDVAVASEGVGGGDVVGTVFSD
jgi:hypothetical protein